MKKARIILVFIVAILMAAWFGTKQASHESWLRGYSDCLDKVVVALAESDEVYLGNLVVSEPNTHVSNVTFFVMDSSMAAFIVDANGLFAEHVDLDCIYEAKEELK